MNIPRLLDILRNRLATLKGRPTIHLTPDVVRELVAALEAIKPATK